jgi:hypothetical protein
MKSIDYAANRSALGLALAPALACRSREQRPVVVLTVSFTPDICSSRGAEGPRGVRDKALPLDRCVGDALTLALALDLASGRVGGPTSAGVGDGGES